MAPLIGWQAIEDYIQATWAIHPSVVKRYHRREMLKAGAVLKRNFGRPPHRHIKAFTIPILVDQWVIRHFRTPLEK